MRLAMAETNRLVLNTPDTQSTIIKVRFSDCRLTMLVALFTDDAVDPIVSSTAVRLTSRFMLSYLLANNTGDFRLHKIYLKHQ